jgi:tryptophan synthase alpha chain
MSIKLTHRPGLVAYITCGDPSLEVSRDVALAAIEAGADVIELGVPFSDPVADGPVIQRASVIRTGLHSSLWSKIHSL